MKSYERINAAPPASGLFAVLAIGIALAGCAIKEPPTGEAIMPESAREKIPG